MDCVTFARIDPDAGERFVSLRRALGVESFGINLMILEPGQRGRIHVHAQQEEVFLVWAGRLTIAIDGVERDLGAGELVRVAAPVRRQLLNRGPERAVVVAMGASGPHVGRDGTAFASWDDMVGGAPQEIPLPADLPAEELRR